MIVHNVRRIHEKVQEIFLTKVYICRCTKILMCDENIYVKSTWSLDNASDKTEEILKKNGIKTKKQKKYKLILSLRYELVETSVQCPESPLVK